MISLSTGLPSILIWSPVVLNMFDILFKLIHILGGYYFVRPTPNSKNYFKQLSGKVYFLKKYYWEYSNFKLLEILVIWKSWDIEKCLVGFPSYPKLDELYLQMTYHGGTFRITPTWRRYVN